MVAVSTEMPQCRQAPRLGTLCLLAALLCWTTEAQQTEGTIFQTALISSGKNRPAISIRAENLGRFWDCYTAGCPWLKWSRNWA
jgi:hypothetical protein